MSNFHEVEKGEYKGKPTLTLRRAEDDRFPFSFGIGKAKLMVKHFKAIKEFVNDNSKS